MTKNVMSSCSTCLGTNLPLAAVCQPEFLFIYILISLSADEGEEGKHKGEFAE